MKFTKTLLYILSGLSLLFTLLPFIRSNFWIFRIFDYPRLQKFVLAAVLLSAWFIIYFHDLTQWDKIMVALLSASFIYLGCLILPFTPIGKKMILKSDGGKSLSLLVSNVYQDNAKYNALLDLVRKKNPDIIFLVETDKRWLEHVKSLREHYPHYVEIPRGNTYGLLLYSRLPLVNHEVKYLVDPEIPSVIADVEFDGNTIRLFGIHPTPPVPQENPTSTDRDAEILLVGKLAKKHQGPCLVIGDMNDVAWSYTTKLFLKTSGLLDPRRGRGLYSTFNARYPMLRWPLDHFFVSGHFRLKALNVENSIGSDHFPISISLTLAPKDESGKKTADAKDRKLAEKKIKEGGAET